MKNKINLGAIIVLSLLTMIMTGCSFSVGTTPNSGNTANTNTAANKPANTAANSANNATAPKKTDAPKAKLENEKKPEGQSTKAKDVPVPADWIYHYNEQRGYGFSLPAGSEGTSETVNGVDVFIAGTPAPSEIAVIVVAFKDAKLSKEDLLNQAEEILKTFGTTITAGKLTGESDDYSVAEATLTGADGKKGKAKILVGLDKTDNYVMIVGTGEEKFAANEKIIDEIWGSFEMWSGGASGGK